MNAIQSVAIAAAAASIIVLGGCDQQGGASSTGSEQGSDTTGTTVTPAANDNAAAGRDGTATTAGKIAPVQVTPAILDFGTLAPHQEVAGSVELKNVGDRPLRILTSRSSCNCTSVDLSNVIIEPGQSIPLDAMFESGDSLGSRTAAVRVLFEGGYDLLEVAIRAHVTLPVSADPSYIDAQHVLVGQFTVTSIDGRPFNILGVNNSPPTYLGFDPATDAPRNSYTLRWDFTGFNPQTCLNQYGDRFPAYLAIETDHPDCGVLDLQVRHQCTRPVIPRDGRHWVLPGSRALIGTLRPGEEGEFDIELVWIHNSAPDDTIYEVTSSNPEQFEAELVGDARRIGDDITCRVRITPNPAHRGLIYGTVLFHSSRHSAPYLVIGTVVE